MPRLYERLGQVNTATSGTQSFSKIGTAAFSNKAGGLRYEVIEGRAHVFGDTDGDGDADLVFVVKVAAVQGTDCVL